MPPLREEWDRYRTAERLFWGAFVSGVIAFVVLNLAAADTEVSRYGGAVVLLLLLGMMPFWRYHTRSLICPYCGEDFYAVTFITNGPDSSRCAHCGAHRPSIWTSDIEHAA